MKFKLTIRREKTFPILFALIITFTFGACAKSITFENSTVEPAAVGKVKVKKDKNNNYSIDVSITHLASPKRLSPSRDVYIVWVETPNNGSKNIGRINISSGLLSKTLRGSLKTVTSFKPKKVFVTAEPEGEVHHPGTPVVLTTESF